MSIDTEAAPTSATILATIASARRELDAWAAHIRRRNEGEPGHLLAAERAAMSTLAGLQAAACDTRQMAREARLEYETISV